MERLDRIKLAIEKGITCDPITGKVYGVKGKEIIRKNIGGYIDIGMVDNKKTYHLYAHQFVYYIATGNIVDCIDHINGIRNDNRIDNIREVTHQQNLCNITKVKGYNWNKQNKNWNSSIYIDGKKIHLGSFTTEQEAHQAYLDAKKIYHNI